MTSKELNRTLAAVYFTAWTVFAYADKGFLLGLSIAAFIGIPMALGFLVGKGDSK